MPYLLYPSILRKREILAVSPSVIITSWLHSLDLTAY